MEFIKNNKRILLIVGVVLIFGLIIVSVINRSPEIPEDEPESKVDYTEEEQKLLDGKEDGLYKATEDPSYNVKVEYPSTWTAVQEDYSDDTREYEYFLSESDDGGFEYNVTYERLSDQALAAFDDDAIIGDGMRLVADDYLMDDFEILSITDGASLYVSKTGATSYDTKEFRLESGSIQLNKDYYVYQRYSSEEFGEGLHSSLNVFQSVKEDYPVASSGVVISYKFTTFEALQKWDLYKQVLKEVVSSLEKTEQ